jgi:hypothetical protein
MYDADDMHAYRYRITVEGMYLLQNRP